MNDSLLFLAVISHSSSLPGIGGPCSWVQCLWVCGDSINSLLGALELIIAGLRVIQLLDCADGCSLIKRCGKAVSQFCGGGFAGQ